VHLRGLDAPDSYCKIDLVLGNGVRAQCYCVSQVARYDCGQFVADLTEVCAGAG
jgi:hypothetical protein